MHRLKERLHHQRFTRPTRDMVIVSVWDPRRKTTVVFAAPHPIPVGPKITTGFEVVSVTPRLDGPGVRHHGSHPCATNRSMRNVSAASVTHARVDWRTAALRPTASAVVTSRMARSDSSQFMRLA